MSKDKTLIKIIEKIQELANTPCSDVAAASELYELIKSDVMDNMEIHDLNKMLSKQ